MKWISILEDNAERTEAMRAALNPFLSRYRIHFTPTAPDMISWLKANLVGTALLSLDHDLGPNFERDGQIFDPLSGTEVSDFLATQTPTCPIILHSSNYVAVPSMINTLSGAGWTTARVSPFSDLLWIEISWLPEVRRCLEHSV